MDEQRGWRKGLLIGDACAQVKEAIVTSALLKLPQKMPRAEKMQRVEEILTELVRAAPCTTAAGLQRNMR